MDFLLDRVGAYLPNIEKLIFSKSIPLTGFKYLPCDYKKTGEGLPVVDEGWQVFSENDVWGLKPDTHAWFYKKLAVTDDMKDKKLVFYFSIGEPDKQVSHEAQFIVYNNGKIIQGLDEYHRFCELEADENGELEIYIYAYTSRYACKHLIVSSLNALDEFYKDLYFDFKVPYDTLKILDESTKDYADIIIHLNNAINMIDMRAPHSAECRESCEKAKKYLQEEFYGKCCKATDVNCICIGHTHIDVAWLWTLAQTREKVCRTFSTVVTMMKQYPEYKFMSSQAQLYEYIKEESPEIYEEIKRLVKEGRWEVEGAMWLEADCNLTSGESLVRQVLFGKRFFKKEFDVDSKVLWLPDVFGYSAALPQILRKSGVDKFVTSKISWNDHNCLPYDSFMWRGIDSTEVFTHFMTAQDTDKNNSKRRGVTYTAKLNPSQARGSWNRYQQKHINNESLMTFGWGDGGGGPVPEYLEYHRRMKHGIPSIPNTKIEFAGDFLNRAKAAAESNPKTPRWVGELYLEFHRGTYTSNAANKRYNRKCEFLYQNTELFNEINRVKNGGEYPQDKINSGWKCILLNQFHDIIPGSSVKEVYDESKVQYEEITAQANAMLSDAQTEIAAKINTDGGIAVFNPNSFVADGVIDVDGEKLFVKDIPAKGWRVVKANESCGDVKVSEKKIENDFFAVEFADDYSITSIFDKRNNRSVLAEGKRGNVIEAFEDFNNSYDAWELSKFHKEKCWEINDVQSVEILDEGVRKGFKVIRKFLTSTFEQKIWLYADIDRIDFETQADWQTEHIAVKAAFPVDINAEKATYEIQFGSVERPTHSNTSWDSAKFEVCAHKYADLSECDYGVSLLNDCKYGHDIHDNVMRLTLLKCPTHPSPVADKGHHEFTYSLMPHGGDYRQAGVVKQAYALNNPMYAVKLGKQSGSLPESFSFVSTSHENVVIDTVKKAEDSSSTIVRLYESWNKRVGAVEIKFGYDVKRVALCDLLENELETLTVENNTVTIPVKPFEIITLKAE